MDNELGGVEYVLSISVRDALGPLAPKLVLSANSSITNDVWVSVRGFILSAVYVHAIDVAIEEELNGK